MPKGSRFSDAFIGTISIAFSLLVFGPFVWFVATGQMMVFKTKSFSSTKEEKVSSIKDLLNKFSKKNSIDLKSNKSPFENYKNPYKECNFKNADYSRVTFGIETRLCINKFGKITKVNIDEETRDYGFLNKARPIGLFNTELMELRIEGSQIIVYECPRDSDTLICNGKSSRVVFAEKRF